MTETATHAKARPLTKSDPRAQQPTLRLACMTEDLTGHLLALLSTWSRMEGATAGRSSRHPADASPRQLTATSAPRRPGWPRARE
jgi:hypothetical protein